MEQLISALVEARKEMEPIIADERAKMGNFSFMYASLPNILKTVVPVLSRHGVFLTQEVSSSNKEVYVSTTLLHKDEMLHTGNVMLPYDGTARDLSGKVTTLRRVQLLAILGLAAEEEETSPPPTNRAAQGPPPAPTQPRTTPGSWDKQAGHRKAAQQGQQMLRGTPATVQTLAERLRMSDDDNAVFMPIVPAEGKKVSMYHYTLNAVGVSDPEGVLSFLVGRVVTEDFPLRLSHKWLIDELADGRHKEAFTAVERIIHAGQQHRAPS